MALSAQDRAAAAEILRVAIRWTLDPLGWVQSVYPWGEGVLAGEKGPRAWQVDFLGELGEALRRGHDTNLTPILRAVGSGHGIGKSALNSWLIGWGLSTCPHAKIVITADTETQLRTKTWPEVAKWWNITPTRHSFSLFGTSIISNDPGSEKTWRADAVTWSENNTQAFAGLHNLGRRIVMLFDEASGIADPVWQVASGAYTDRDTEIIHVATGQITEPAGAFYDCFQTQKHRWHPRAIDSRTVEGTNLEYLNGLVEAYGEDSDYVRVRVRGLPPRSGTSQFISTDVVQDATTREAYTHLSDPLIIGVDVARFGADQSVIAFRRGRDARLLPMLKFRGIDTMQLAGRVAEEYHKLRADAVFVDEGGLGAGVVDRLRQIGVPVIGVNFGAKADRIAYAEERIPYGNKRSEMWGNMAEWLAGGMIGKDPELIEELIAPQKSYAVKDGRDCLMLERKEDMRKRGVSSPDCADALALTFAYPVLPQIAGMGGGLHAPEQNKMEYDPWAA